jgi:1-deoxy-D-xylulose-5-phosphate reductoisomerase
VTRPRRIVLLGSTGSIGTQALDVAARHRDLFSVVGISAGGADVELLARQAVEFGVEAVAVRQATAASDLQLALYAEAQRRGFATGEASLPRIIAGPDASTELAGWDCDVVLNGLAGAAGLRPTLAALEAGSTLALANKESLIIGGPLVKALARPGQIIPVDSEHSALAQALRSGTGTEVRRLVLTASGGPFRGWDRAALDGVTVEQALAHPTWSMGPLVTINSATLMNKGLEVIEAHLLFDVAFDAIDVVVHPQSVVHSMVEFVDGSTIAQASPPDMRIPIAWGMSWPDRVPDVAPACDWTAATSWDFFPLDEDAFPAIRLARTAGAAGGTAPAVFNGADEACVAAFMAGSLPFTGIVATVQRVVDEHLAGLDPSGAWIGGNNVTLADVSTADAWSRRRAAELASEWAKEGRHA